MKIILLEKIAKLGNIGDIVSVKSGFARNFLLPKTKALYANKINISNFKAKKSKLIALNTKIKEDAEIVKTKMINLSVIAIRPASESGQLYGSVSKRDIANLIFKSGIKIKHTQIFLEIPIKTIGISNVSIILHPEVKLKITINVARSFDEANQQTKNKPTITTNVTIKH